MLSVLFYLLFVSLLVFWLESSVNISSNLLIVRRRPAEELEEWLKQFNWSSRTQLASNRGQLPKYKFYSDVVELLLSLARKMGGHYQESLIYLRQGLMNDRQFEKKLKEIILGTWLQMAMMMGLTWLFIFAALGMIEVSVSPVKLILILIWQCIGLSTLPFILGYYRKKFFGDIGLLWKMLYVLNSLARVPLSRSEVLSVAGISDLSKIKQNSLSALVEKLKATCQKTLKLGQNYEEEVKSLMEELRFQEKWHFELFEKRMGAVKLGILSLFFLPAYLSFIFLLLGDLMTVM